MQFITLQYRTIKLTPFYFSTLTQSSCAHLVFSIADFCEVVRRGDFCQDLISCRFLHKKKKLSEFLYDYSFCLLTIRCAVICTVWYTRACLALLFSFFQVTLTAVMISIPPAVPNNFLLKKKTWTHKSESEELKRKNDEFLFVSAAIHKFLSSLFLHYYLLLLEIPCRVDWRLCQIRASAEDELHPVIKANCFLLTSCFCLQLHCWSHV